jgi:carboxypeptidase PM20D1
MRKPIVLFLILLFSAKSMSAQLIELDTFSLRKSALPTTMEHLLVQYIQHPSVSGQELEAGEFLRSICERTGLYIQQFGNQNGEFNFAASLYPLHLGKPNLIFLNHIDVVPAGEEQQWQYHPFEGRIINGQIWGRGAFDNKGVAVMQLAAIARFVRAAQQQDLPFNVTFLAVSCEETQCGGGARYVAAHHYSALNPWAIVGEGPPALEGVINADPEQVIFGIATGHKRAFWVKLELEVSTSGHGSVTPLKYSTQQMVLSLEKVLSKKRKAVYTPENLEILRNLGRLEGGIMGFVLKKPRLFKPLIVPQLRKQPEVFALFSNTVTLTNLSTSTTAHNTIPEKTTALLDCRLLPQTDEQAFLKNLKKQLGQEGISAEVVMHTPAAPCSDRSHQVYNLLETAIHDHFGNDIEVIPILLPNINDSGWFRARGVPVFDLIPARVTRQHLHCVHSYNERIPISALHEGETVYARLLESLMAQNRNAELTQLSE